MNIMYSHLANEVRVVLNEDQGELLQYEFSDEHRRVVRRGKLPQQTKTHNISTSGLPDGLYQFHIGDKTISFEKRKLFVP